jgi:HEAT repeat protein
MPLTAIELAFVMALSIADVERLEKYETASVDSGDAQTLAEQARADFAGRGVEIANHFLTHTDARPRNDAYFYVLRTVGDTETALVLIRALPNPPAHESGILDRDLGEIAVAIEAVLTSDATRSDPRIAEALDQAIATARAKSYGSGAHAALEAVRLLGYCRSAEAGGVLRRLATDPDAAVRTAAARALGQLGASEAPLPSDRMSPAQDVLRLLLSDPNPPTRRQAAESAGFLEAPEVVPALQAALRTESDPRVVDAILQSLRRRGAPVDDPMQCRTLIGRTWEAVVAEQMLDCWNRSGVAPGALIEAALDGPATQRAAVLVAVASPQPRARSLVRVPQELASFDPPIRTRLLDSAVWVLSQGDDISSSSRDTAERALWEISGRDMDLSLQYADRITPHAARFRASSALARADLTAYDATRRQRQAAFAMLMALGIALVMLVRSAPRRPVVLLAASAAGWAVWSVQASGVRELPPPPMQLLSVGALACFSAGFATSGAALAARRSSPGRIPTAVRIVLVLVAAGVIGATVCGITRNTGLFPSDMGGWERIFDPLAAMILAVVAAAILMSLDGIVSRVRQIR